MSPKNQERRFRPAYARTLLNIAHQDHATAEYTQTGVASGRVRPENVFILYHQAIEKLLKAVLCHLGIAVSLVHALGVLLAKLPEDVRLLADGLLWWGDTLINRSAEEA